LIARLRERGIIVETTSITNFDFSEVFNQAIENKVTQEQLALAAKNQLERVKFEAQQQIEAAKGKAEALTIEGDALKNNPQIAQLRWIEKWDGKLSVVSTGTMPLMNIDNLMNK
jgi:regulator of protease activity HflC (stomatin/prohibitin superfamily)